MSSENTRPKIHPDEMHWCSKCKSRDIIWKPVSDGIDVYCNNCSHTMHWYAPGALMKEKDIVPTKEDTDKVPTSDEVLWTPEYEAKVRLKMTKIAFKALLRRGNIYNETEKDAVIAANEVIKHMKGLSK